MDKLKYLADILDSSKLSGPTILSNSFLGRNPLKGCEKTVQIKWC